ncbi:MAG: type 2 isopentenyl-diphosphate Delta-isomerase [Anaerolineales bacterium]|jgi:isopentenyl-diphosphate delta-isomerase
MSKVTRTSERKSDHVRINLEQDVRSGLSTGLEDIRFKHIALPELDFDTVNIRTSFLDKELNLPLLISSMTGGASDVAPINRRLAEAAQHTGIAMGVGSQRAALEDEKYTSSFAVRDVAPDILLFANLGAVQLNYGLGPEHCQRAVDMVQADALVLHLNALQEVLQPEGDKDFSNLLHKIEAVCKKVDKPVIAKEVGWGISGEVASKLTQAGVAVIDVAGAGGTSWSQVEMHRAENKVQAELAASFIDWGLTTTEAVQSVRSRLPNVPLIASGGLRDGIDVAKCIALGANMGGMAGQFLKSAAESTEAVIERIELTAMQLQVVMFATASESIQDLDRSKLISP